MKYFAQKSGGFLAVNREKEQKRGTIRNSGERRRGFGTEIAAKKADSQKGWLP